MRTYIIYWLNGDNPVGVVNDFTDEADEDRVLSAWLDENEAVVDKRINYYSSEKTNATISIH